MAIPTNILQQVETYQKSNLAYLLNHFAFLNKANKKFKNFDTMTANLGDTVTFDLPPRFITNSSLIATFQGSTQRVHSLTVDQAENTAYAFNAQQFIFNVREYMDKFGASAMAELGTSIESNIALNAITHTYRFYGDGINAIDSYTKLATAMAYYRNYGAPKTVACGFLDDLAIPAIIGTGLSQFVPKRNEEIANSWELGGFADTDWYKSNLLPVHTAGTIGDASPVQPLTITAITTDADGGISALTCSGGGVAVDAIKAYDLLYFQDGVTGQPNVRYLTFIGHKPSGNTVQIRATADADSVADSVIIPIYPKLYSVAGPNQNVTQTIAIGMKLTVLPSHRAGLIYAGDALFLGMPQLPDEDPFKTVSIVDPDSGASIRMYYGSKFGLNERGVVNDCIWGSTGVDEYMMRLVFPL